MNLGDFPLEAVSYMSGMCKEAERVEAATDHANLFEALREESKNHNRLHVPTVRTYQCPLLTSLLSFVFFVCCIICCA